jgi:hypothetical protein
MDGDKNEAEGLKVEGFPTLYLYKEGGEEVEYRGRWEFEPIVVWMAENSDTYMQFLK